MFLVFKAYSRGKKFPFLHHCPALIGKQHSSCWSQTLSLASLFAVGQWKQHINAWNIACKAESLSNSCILLKKTLRNYSLLFLTSFFALGTLSQVWCNLSMEK